MFKTLVQAWKLTRRDMIAGEALVSEKHKYQTWLCKRAQLQARLTKPIEQGWNPMAYLNQHKIQYKLESPSFPIQTKPAFLRRDITPSWLRRLVRIDPLDMKTQDQDWKQKLDLIKAQDAEQKYYEEELFKRRKKEVYYNSKIIQKLVNIYSRRYYKSASVKALEYVQLKNVVKEFVFEQPEEGEEGEEAAVVVPSSTFTLDDAMRVLNFTTKPTKEEVDERVEKLKQLNDPEKGGSLFLAKKAEEAGTVIIRALGSRVPFPNLVGKSG